MKDIVPEHAAQIDALVVAARKAMQDIAHYDQADADRLVTAAAWAIYREDRARELAEMAVRDTGLGNVEDKVIKNRRKTLGTLGDLLRETTVGEISREPELGLVTYGKPVGVVGAMTPSTNPAATPINKAMMALKSKNAIIISPSPSGAATAYRLQEFVHAEFDAIGAPRALFQVVPLPVNLAKANYLARSVDLILVTGDQGNVRNGYRSGTPCIGVGKGNVPVIVDASANAQEVAKKICLSKCFDNATSCSSENAVIVHEDAYDTVLKALEDVGGYLCSAGQTREVEAALFGGGTINRDFIGKPVDTIMDGLGWEKPDRPVKFLMVEQSETGPDAPLSGEKLSLVLSVYKARDFDEACETVDAILDFEGLGHSVGIHTEDPEQPEALARRTRVARVLVNQAHTFGNGGGFDNSLPFTLSMGCGTWGRNSISENLSYKNFFNVTKLVQTIDKPHPDPDMLFAGFA